MSSRGERDGDGGTAGGRLSARASCVQCRDGRVVYLAVCVCVPEAASAVRTPSPSLLALVGLHVTLVFV